jgi:methylenetetrahydrofolate--tRNA-(uracil-5-)-methyltransferase
MQVLGCKLLAIAESCSVPAGQALAVDRNLFAQKVTDIISSDPNISLIRRELDSLPDGVVILATGPLTSDTMSVTYSIYCLNSISSFLMPLPHC